MSEYSAASATLPSPVTLSPVLATSPAQAAAPSPLTVRAEALRVRSGRGLCTYSPAVNLTRCSFDQTKIGELDAIIRTTKENLQADLQLAKHLAVLTPFRTSTRERILAALPPIEKRVRHHRMQ